MKTRLPLLLSTTAALALLFSSAAHATLQIGVSEDGGAFVFSPTSNTGALTFTPTETNFGNITISTSGVPIEVSPDLATTDLSAENTGTGTHTLTVVVFQTGLATVTANLQSTFTVNNLIGTGLTTGDSTLSDFINGTGTNLGTPLHSQDFPAGTIDASTIAGPTNETLSSDAQEFVVTFNAGQTITDTIQTIGVPAAVPEPSSLLILGTMLGGLGLLFRRRSRKSHAVIASA